MTGARMFWLEALHDCDLDRPLSLPHDRHRLSNEHRSGRGTSVTFAFGDDLSRTFLAYASSHNIPLQQLALASYYAFLFKLSNGERDICLGMNTHGRYREELHSVIGMFVNAFPLRCQLDPHRSFHALIELIETTLVKSTKYSYFPLQRILAQHLTVLKPVFMDMSFEFSSYASKKTQPEIRIGDSRLQGMRSSLKISDDEIMTKFDFFSIIQHDCTTDQLSCTINASRDLFSVETVGVICQRFHSLLRHTVETADEQMSKPVYELSIVLADERLLAQSMSHTQSSLSPANSIHHEVVSQAMRHEQKLAVELDEQSLTYAELLHHAQDLSLHLLTHHDVAPGEVICQCVERSLSMVKAL